MFALNAWQVVLSVGLGTYAMCMLFGVLARWLKVPGTGKSFESTLPGIGGGIGMLAAISIAVGLGWMPAVSIIATVIGVALAQLTTWRMVRRRLNP